MNYDVINEVKKTYEELLPHVDAKDLDEAIAVCYQKGITIAELSKATYEYLYPVREPFLYEDE